MAELSQNQRDMLKERYGLKPNGLYFLSAYGYFVWVGDFKIENGIFYDKQYCGQYFYLRDMKKTDREYTLEEVIESGWIEHRRFGLMNSEDKRAVIELMLKKKGLSTTLDFITNAKLGYTDEEVLKLFSAK